MNKNLSNKEREIEIDNKRLSDLFNSGLTQKEISNEFGCSTYPIAKALKNLGLKRPAAPRKGIQSGSKNPAWKGGRRKRTDGYIAIWTEDGERLEHQIIAENMLGRPLYSNEIVHHKNHKRDDNRPENLEVMTQSDHIKLHRNEMQKARNSK